MREPNDESDQNQIAAFLQQTKQEVSMAAKILAIDQAKLVRAAGGVILRRGRGRERVAVIHRPRYDDWAFPKGKLDDDETLETAALREVEEETGYRCRLVRPLGCTAYVDRRGRDKVACYWVMEPIDGRFRVSDEVDELRWVKIDEALQVLTYPHDRALLRSLDLKAS
jgi:8-oxo-dGTP pyrophosphatase MutT (NUDIX family)